MLGRRAEAESADGTAFAGLRELERRRAGQRLFRGREQRLRVLGREGRPPRDPDWPARAGDFVTHARAGALAGIGLLPFDAIRGEGRAERHGPNGGERLAGFYAVVADREIAAGEIEDGAFAIGEAIDAEIPPARPATLRVAAGHEVDG